uniref:ABC transporter permease n=1 Tax=Paractinoplanes polyasparticus TaxID=2856853 RepID=UPI001C849F80|nr:ABC transporter permease [Actinoplanes polyasparticus]
MTAAHTDRPAVTPEEPVAEPAGRRLVTRLAATPEIGVIATVIVLFIVFSAASESFAGVSNLQTMGFDLAQYGILALGVSFVILTGGIDLSLGSVVALTAVVSAWLNARAELPAPAAIAVTLLLAAAIGVLHGVFVTRLGVPPFVTTLITLVAARGAALAITKGFPIDGVSETFTDLNAYRVLLIPVPTAIFIVCCVAAWVFLERTYAGRQLYAVGGNREAARLAGIRTERRIMLAYVVSALCAGLVGVLITSRLSVGQPGVGQGWELTAIAAAVIGGISLSGGAGRVVGVAFGAILLVVINTGLVILHVSPYYQQIVLGLVLAVAVTTDRIRSRRLARARRATP